MAVTTMQHIDNQRQYDSIVHDLADEFGTQIAQGVQRSVSMALLSSVTVLDGSPTVSHCAEYEGEAVDSVDSTLSPHDVLTFTHHEWGTNDDVPQTTEQKAVQALAGDLVRAHLSTIDDPRTEENDV